MDMAGAKAESPRNFCAVSTLYRIKCLVGEWVFGRWRLRLQQWVREERSQAKKREIVGCRLAVAGGILATGAKGSRFVSTSFGLRSSIDWLEIDFGFRKEAQ
jgi:hypothetical protein